MSDAYREHKLALDAVYEERDRLVAALSKILPAHLSDHEGSEPWDDDWKNVVCIHLPSGQVAWHIKASELPWFSHLKRLPSHYDGHTTEEKYKRLERWS